MPPLTRILRVRYYLPNQLLIQGALHQVRVCYYAVEAAFEFAYVAVDARAEQLYHLLARLDSHLLRLGAQDSQPCLQVGRLYVHDKPAAQPRAYALFQYLERRHGAVAGYHDLPIRHVQRVEGVEEAFLRLLLADEELDVVEQQHARAAVLLAELFGLALANGADVLVGELFGCRVDEAHALGERLLSDSVHQVRLAQPDFRVHH